MSDALKVKSALNLMVMKIIDELMLLLVIHDWMEQK